MPKRIPHTDLEIITGDKKTKDYLEMQKKFGRFYFRKFFNILSDFNKHGTFLEIGPGPGYQSCEIAKKIPGAKIKALEYSKDMISIAREYSKTQKVENRIEFIHGSVEDKTILKDLGKFDLIYSTFSLHHWSDPRKAFSNLYSLLKKDGLIYVYDFKRGGLFYYLPIERGLKESVRASYIPCEIEKMLKELNIKNYRIKTKYPYMWVVIKN